MANEIRMNFAIQVDKDSIHDQWTPKPLSIDQTGSGRGGYTQMISYLYETTLNFGDITPGQCVLQNLDATHYVIVGPVSGGVMVPAIKLRAGVFDKISIAPGSVWHALADTANVQLDVRAWAD